MKAPDLYGLILIGGRSTRMGTDKSLLRYHEADQRHFNYNFLSPYCSKAFLSCNQKQAADIELDHIIDKEDQQGPLTGLLSAFAQYPDVAWLVLACDMPYVNDHVIKTLIAHRDPKKLATCFYHDFPEPLCTIWEPAAFKVLQEFTASGVRSPRRFLEDNDTNYIMVDNAFKHHLININSPQERNRLK
ncbi:MAG: NTP transferase domain-containing protein [Fulvivirga sp.]